MKLPPILQKLHERVIKLLGLAACRKTAWRLHPEHTECSARYQEIKSIAISQNTQTQQQKRPELPSTTINMCLEQSNRRQKDDSSVVPSDTIWTFWDGNPPELVLRCIETMRRNNPERPLIVVSRATLHLFLSSGDYPMFHGRHGGPDDFSCPQYLADWVRIMLLEKYGGVWFDASIICTNDVESWCTASKDNDCENKITMFPMHANPNCHGNWAMAVEKPGHPLLRAWKEELSAIFNEIGPCQVPTRYCERAFVDNPDLIDLWNNPSPPPLPYLWVYLALQVVLQKKPKLHSTIRMLPSIDGPMYRRFKLNVNQGIVDSYDLSQATANDLANEPLCREHHDRYFIKLVGRDRDPCAAILNAGAFQKNSVLDFLASILPRSIEYGTGTNLQSGATAQKTLTRSSRSRFNSSNQRFRAATHAVLISRYLAKVGTQSFDTQQESLRCSADTQTSLVLHRRGSAALAA